MGIGTKHRHHVAMEDIQSTDFPVFTVGWNRSWIAPVTKSEA